MHGSSTLPLRLRLEGSPGLTVCPHAEYVSASDAAPMVAGDRIDIFAGAVIEFLYHRVPGRG